jgi:hypothetical protein
MILVGSLMETRDEELETGVKAILAIQLQRTWKNCVHALGVCGR